MKQYLHAHRESIFSHRHWSQTVTSLFAGVARTLTHVRKGPKNIICIDPVAEKAATARQRSAAAEKWIRGVKIGAGASMAAMFAYVVWTVTTGPQTPYVRNYPDTPTGMSELINDAVDLEDRPLKVNPKNLEDVIRSSEGAEIPVEIDGANRSVTIRTPWIEGKRFVAFADGERCVATIELRDADKTAKVICAAARLEY